MAATGSRAAAWAVHAFTASGALWGLLALAAIADAEWRAAFVWMTVALAVDAFDGMLARAAKVKQVLPGFDGDLLDNTLDYMNYAFVPAFFLQRADLLPAGLGVAGAGAIVLASAYQFCQADAKTEDHYFKGFPSYWNVLVFYLFLGGLAPQANLAIVAFFVALVFVPLKWIYPSRMSRWRGVTIAATCVWGALCIAIIVRLPEPSPGLLFGSLAYVGYYVGVSLYLTARPAG